MRYYLDTEFDGFGGPLLSLALVREDGASFYVVTSASAENEWVKANVEPILLAPAWLQCAGKEPYATANLAQKVCARRNDSRKFRHKDERKLQPYRCLHCGKWHIGGVGK